MSFLLDTNICIYYLNGDDQELVERILALGPEPLAISTLSLAELHFGAARSARPEANRERIAFFVRELPTQQVNRFRTPPRPRPRCVRYSPKDRRRRRFLRT